MRESSERQALEALWKARLRDVRLRMDFCRQYASEAQRDAWARGIPSEGGSYRYRLALRQERMALAEYRHVLRVYTDLVLRGTVPNESDWLAFSAGGDGKPQ